MGNEYANQIGRGSAAPAAGNDASGSVVGKQSLSSQEVIPPRDELVERVKAHVGRELVGGGGYKYVVTPEGAFRITKAPEEKRVGRVITMTGPFAPAWKALAASLEPVATPAPQAVTASTPKPVAPPPPPEPSLLDRAIGTVESGLHDLRDGASALWDRATNWMHSGSEATPDKATPPSNTNVPATPATATPAPNKPPLAQPEAPAGPRPAPGGDTLELAMSQAAKGTKGTEYTLDGLDHVEGPQIRARYEELSKLLEKHDKAVAAKKKNPNAAVEGELPAEEEKPLREEWKALKKKKLDASSKLAADLASGKMDVKRFYCSGLSLWTLAAAGYNINERLKGPDGKEYCGEVKEDVSVDASGKRVKKEKEDHKERLVTRTEYVTLKLLVDGDATAIEIVTRAELEKSSTVELKGTGYQTEGDLAKGSHGAASAFVAARIGTEVPELQQKPGDFAQSRRSTAGKHIGAGHAWQVTEVRASGSALFGKVGRSPEPERGTLDGWHENVPFLIKPTTDPLLVGVHTVTAAKRVEAQNEGVVADKANDTAKDGGVQVTGWKPAPDHGLADYKDYVVFYGRLNASKWNGWNAATKESAETAAATAPAPAAATPAAATPAAATPAAATPAAATPAATTPSATTPESTAPAATTPASE